MTSELSVNEICDIIQKCSDCGVSELKLGGLEVRFKNELPSDTSRKEITEIPVTIEEHSQGPEKETPTMSQELLEEMEADIKQSQLEFMLVEDPAQFEELLLSGEIVNEETRGT